MIKKMLLPILLILLLSGCIVPEETLAYPASLHLNNEVLSWDAVENATFYTININDEEYDTAELFFDLNFLDNGIYEIKILAYNGAISSLYSPVINMTIDRDYTAPQHIVLVDDVFVTWDAISSVTSYSIWVDNEVVGTTLVTSYDLTDLLLDNNRFYQIQVTGNYGIHPTEKSDTIAYHNYLSIGELIQETYTLNQDTPVVLSFMNSIVLDYVLVDDILISTDLYSQTINEIELDSSIFESLELGIHEVHLLTPSGYITVEVTVINPDRPYMISDSNVTYANQDMSFEFNLVGGTFVGLSGNDITTDDFTIDGSSLSIHASYVDNILSLDPSRETIILVYQLNKDSHTVIGYIFINIPQET